LEKEMETTSQPMRRYQADLGARLDKLQMEVQNLMGRFEESKYFAQKTFGETKTLKEAYQGKLDELDKRLAALNKSVEEWEKKIAAESKAPKGEAETGEEKPSAIQVPPAQGGPTKEQVPSQKAEPEGKKVAASPDEVYKKAYEQFTKGNVEGAKVGFKGFLEGYPKSKYAENAHYWLGECYFAEKKYEEAILEFDEVIKKYPKGNKVPDALFRQGIAFLEMKDTINAKLILKEVVKRYPKSDQANRARKKLKEIG
jgi:tol-pal system protein YbgF